ncbi:IolE protein-like protein [Staphylococcus aureus]|nr:IolE protein-like protein [Staphylococcus aureus]
MKIGVFSVLFYDKNFEDMLDYVSESGLDMIEVGTGGNPGDKFCKLDELLENEDKRQAFMKSITDRGLQISGFSCHNNPISPDPIEAKEADETLRKTIRLANLLDVPVVNTFSGIAQDQMIPLKSLIGLLHLGQQPTLKFMIISGMKS